MTTKTTISARIDKKLDDKLARIAKSMGRSKSWALNEALIDYLSANDGYVAAVEKGRRAFAEGRSLDHEAVEKYFAVKLGEKRRSRRAA